MGGQTDGRMNGQTAVPSSVCPLNFFEVEGITMHICRSYGPGKLKFMTILSFDLYV